MDQNNTATSYGKLMDISNCRVNRDGAGLASCLVKEPCRWAIPVLNIKYCTNPSMVQVTVQPTALFDTSRKR